MPTDRPSSHPGLREHEFPTGHFDALSSLQRREFLRLMAASLALSGVGCSRNPPESIVPHTHAQTAFIPGVPQWYASAVTRRGRAMGVLVRTDDGRPTKLEGNPDHPASLGATDAVTQAELLTLYDPARSRAVRARGAASDWDSLWRELVPRLEELRTRSGRGLHVVLPPLTSPTAVRLVERLESVYPEAAWYRHDPYAADDESNLSPPATDAIDAADASFIVSLDADLFAPHPAGVRWQRDFISPRRASLAGSGLLLPRLFVAEPVPTITGSRADERAALSPLDISLLCHSIGARLGVCPPPATLTPEIDALAARLARDLRSAGAAGRIVAGERLPASCRWVAHAIARSLAGRDRVRPMLEPLRSLCRPAHECEASLANNEVHTLLLLGVNPAYESAADSRLPELLPRAPYTLHLGLYADETARLCTWHAPMTHDLEAWGDALAFDGTPTIIQPVLEPVVARSLLHVLHQLAGALTSHERELVEATWRERVAPAGWDAWWTRVLRRGVIDDHPSPPDDQPSPDPEASIPATPSEHAVVACIQPHLYLGVGERAENAWLQELPHPLTQLTWTNAALLSTSLAETIGVRTGDIVRIEGEHAVIEIPALVLPGTAPGVVGLTLGHGRQTALGTLGASVRPLRTRAASWTIPIRSLTPTGRRTELPLAQLHDSTHDRGVLRTVSPGEPVVRHAKTVHLPMYEPARPESSQQWGMTIDLAACTGCGACVVACQAENNVPVVGPEEVARGRRMHWIRVDRYFDTGAGVRGAQFQPLACVHCEAAPCELVCPTGATQHSHDGLNEMNYARCIGTRYCSNNCPYKVRRFNFFKYAQDTPEAQRMHNPRVTTRGRGVMEKCTYCVQRIRAAEHDARIVNQPIPDGAVTPACAQACPTTAIIFGDVANADSHVSVSNRSPRAYHLLEELGTRPRTAYLADIRTSAREAP